MRIETTTLILSMCILISQYLTK